MNGERFITDELKKHEEIILTAEEKINQLEYELFTRLLQQILSYTAVIQKAADAVANLDCITNFAFISLKKPVHKTTIAFQWRYYHQKRQAPCC